MLIAYSQEIENVIFVDKYMNYIPYYQMVIIVSGHMITILKGLMAWIVME